MIDSKFHIELNGKKYTLAEDGEGTHYQRKREPLRAPSNGLVLGDTNKFNLRPDLLDWNMTDWSGGEGYKIYDPDTPNGYLVGYDIDATTTGELYLAKEFDETKDSGGSSDFAIDGSMATALDDLFIATNSLSAGGLGYYKWNPTTSRWGTIVTPFGMANGMRLGSRAQGSSGNLYMVTDNGGGDASIWKLAGSFADLMWGTESSWEVREVGGPLNKYLYMIGNDFITGMGLVTEVMQFDTSLPAIAAGTTVFSINDSEIDTIRFGIKAVVGPNKLYFNKLVKAATSALYEITPTSAAEAAWGREVFRAPGFEIETLFYLFGNVFLLGRQKDRTTIFYFDSINETFGVAWVAPEERNHVWVSGLAADPYDMGPWVNTISGQEGFSNHFIHASGPLNDGTEVTLMTLDGITGAVFGGPTWRAGTLSGGFPAMNLKNCHGPVVFEGQIFTQVGYYIAGPASASRTLVLTDNYTSKTGYLYSAINDYGIIDEKVLASFSISLEALPAGNTVVVKYQLDQDGTWLTAGTVSVTGTKEQTFVVSSGSATRRFRNVQVLLELHSDSASETPVVRSVRARATVIKGVRLWSLTLNATDELGAMQNRAWSGETLIENITTAADADSVITFKDGYSKKGPGKYTSYDVVIDDYAVINDRPGEGTVQLLLREVI